MELVVVVVVVVVVMEAAAAVDDVVVVAPAVVALIMRTSRGNGTGTGTRSSNIFFIYFNCSCYYTCCMLFISTVHVITHAVCYYKYRS
jgi:hypothetical protein